MDVFSSTAKLQILSTGLKYKRDFKPFTEVLKMFSAQEEDNGVEEIRRKLLSLCADSHEEFPHPNPLWKNTDFFIRLPFKLNEDINPTKATHLGFWQLGIDPEDRYKTAFYIPNAQYQWTVLPFGLKVAPSLFQKAMVRIFEPIMENTIIYIDDILIFSKDMDSHKKLLSKFFDIVNQHGIMLSERKIYLAKSEIDFLGMHFSQGCYQPQPHIAEELLKFPDHSLTIKQIQQFLGIVNYIRDFIPRVAKYTSVLSRLLKKDPPSWGSKQTNAVQELKKIAQSPPALKIPGEGDRILQTDASDNYWGAVLIEKIGDKKYYCGHASGQFKEGEKHYHTTFKEALAVKNGIKKFDFHLRSFQFEVQMDNSSFPKLLEFKNKMPPDP
ncbi:hypothetical protein CR513_45988, partial [Mucuna pruriens]